jgi:hypothetical protein
LFDNEGGLKRFISGAWRWCGYVHLVRAARSVSADELAALEKGSGEIINSRVGLLAELAAQSSEPLPAGSHALRNVAAHDVRVIDEHGSYPVRSLLCHEEFWKQAIDVLLERADVVVIDLSGYHWENIGTGYELQRVIDRFQIRNCVVLVQLGHGDRQFVDAQIKNAWNRMANGSPNAGTKAQEILIGPLVFDNSMPDSGDLRLARLLQQRLDDVNDPN